MKQERQSLESLFARKEPFIMDGAMSTALERLGCRLNDPLWTASVLIHHENLVKQVHMDYFRAGADCGITCSYQASIPGLLERGYEEAEAEQMIRRAVLIFLEARKEWWETEGKAAGRVYPAALASVGPYGAYLADGSEYRGHYGVSDEVLKSFHRRRMEILWEAGADALLMETFPSLAEAKIAAEIAEEMGADYWISFSCRNEKQINEGTDIAECAKVFSQGYPHCRAIGVNCTPPEYISGLIDELKNNCSLPIGVYPNSGEVYDPLTKSWSGDGMACPFEVYAKNWIAQGAKAVGGCCRTVDRHIRLIRAAVSKK